MTMPVDISAAGPAVRLPEGSLATLLDSPDFYPVQIDFSRRVVTFVRMSRETYRRSVFLDHRTQPLRSDVYELRLDDLLLRAAIAPIVAHPVHYILHPTFSCSTLLARYFELLPFCFVLKEPMLLTQMAFVRPEQVRDWDEVFRLTIRMLTRTYGPRHLVVIKPHEPSNALAAKLIGYSSDCTITFMTTPLRKFVVSVLKSQSRRSWVRTRIPMSAIAAQCPALMAVQPETLTDAQAAAYLWLVNRFIGKQLRTGQYRNRVLMLDADQLVERPHVALKAIMDICAAPVTDFLLEAMIEHPTIQLYSKDLSRPYSASSRLEELAELERVFGAEADAATDWAFSCGMGEYLS